DVGEGIDVGGQGSPTVDVFLIEVGVREKARIPGIIAGGLGPVITVGLAAGGIIGVAEAQVPIPHGPFLEFSVAVLVIKIAETIAVNVLGHLDQPVMVDEGVDVDIGSVAGHWICVAGAAE